MRHFVPMSPPSTLRLPKKEEAVAGKEPAAEEEALAQDAPAEEVLADEPPVDEASVEDAVAAKEEAPTEEEAPEQGPAAEVVTGESAAWVAVPAEPAAEVEALAQESLTQLARADTAAADTPPVEAPKAAVPAGEEAPAAEEVASEKQKASRVVRVAIYTAISRRVGPDSAPAPAAKGSAVCQSSCAAPSLPTVALPMELLQGSRGPNSPCRSPSRSRAKAEETPEDEAPAAAEEESPASAEEEAPAEESASPAEASTTEGDGQGRITASANEGHHSTRPFGQERSLLRDFCHPLAAWVEWICG